MLGCGSAYKSLELVQTDQVCINKNLPLAISDSWYHASVDVVGKHLSGLIFIKNMPDSSRRVVFTSEAGVTFFDFGFGPKGKFIVHSVISKLDRKAVVTTLRKDFELLLGIPFQEGKLQTWRTPEEIYVGAPQKKETAYFITDKDCSSLRRFELGSTKKKKVTIQIAGSYPKPDTLEIRHYTFSLQIKLTRFQKE